MKRARGSGVGVGPDMSVQRLLSVVLVVLLVACTGGQAGARTMNILPLGDSITRSNSDYLGYRYFLWKELVRRDVDFDLVGTQDTNRGGNPYFECYRTKWFDPDHEGHSGWRTTDIIHGRDSEPNAGNLAQWLAEIHKPVDVALVHLGTNDALKGVTSDGKPNAGITIKNLKTIIGTLRASNASITIVLSKLIPLSWSLDNSIRSINSRLDSLAAELSTSQSRIVVVDNYTGFDTDWLYDGVHPDNVGAEFIGKNFAAAIPSAISNPTPAAPVMGIALLGGLLLRRAERRVG